MALLSVLTIIFAAFVGQTDASSIFLDWSSEMPNGGVRAFVLDYSPPVGIPPAGTHLSRSTQQLLLNQTMPATDYSIFLTALMTDGSRRNVSEKHLPSSPNPPILDSIETTPTDATISYFPPEGSEISYYIEYFPVDREEYANFVETKSALVKLRGLDPSTNFRLRVLSVFRGVPSTESIDTTFSTKDLGSGEDMSLFTIKTLPPDLDLGSVTLPTMTNGSKEKEYEYASKEDYQGAGGAANNLVEEQKNQTDVTPDGDQYYYQPEGVTPVDEVTEAPPVPRIVITVTDEVSTSQTPSESTTILPTTAEEELEVDDESDRDVDVPDGELENGSSTEPMIFHPHTTTTTMFTTTPQSTTKKSDMKVTRRSSTTTTTTSATTTIITTTPSTTAPIISREEINPSNGPKTTEAIETEVVDYGSEVSAPVPGVIAEEAGQPSINPDGYGDPSDIWISKEGKMLKIEWEVAEESVCDAFLVNYTVLTLSQPKAFSVASQDSFVLIKMFTDHKLEAKVFCMLSGALSKTWWAHRIIDLSKPQAIHGLRVVNVETDDFYVAKIELEWDWPVFHDFKHNDIVVLYGVGKAPPKKLEVTEKGKVVLDKLEPTEEYIITVRNISRELGINSQDAIIKQQTRPIISSTLYPGQISSTSININFGESDPEQGKFEHYELDFTGNNKNITRKIAMDKDRSFTFTKLIPGKTYKFSLFTVYKSMRSRPVVAEITTYPLKVEKLRPIVGRDYASLHWDIENFADNDVRFRLSYIATSNDGARKERTVQLKNTNHYRFDELDLETYYTFTITVIMGIGEAEAESESEMVTVAFGKDVRSKPALKRHGTRELALIFENDHNMWHELNGPFNNFAVIVAEDIELGGDDYELRSWFEVHNDDKWPSYRASRSDYQPFSKRGVKEAMFIIGEDDCEQQRLDEPYCNGMLRANTKYLAKVRGYTDEGVAMETDWVAIHGHTNGQGDGDEDEEEEEDPGLPCHMYLNGCPRKGDKGKSGGIWKSIMSAIGFLGILML